MGGKDGATNHLDPRDPPTLLPFRDSASAALIGRPRHSEPKTLTADDGADGGTPPITGGAPTIITKAPQHTHQLQDNNKDATQSEHWELQHLTLTCLCNVQSLQDLTNIWASLAPLKKEKARTALEIVCLAWVRALWPKASKITHMVAVLILRLDFHTEDPDGVSDAVNIFMFPDLSLAAGTKVALVTRRWDTALDSDMIMSYANTSALMSKQRISLIMGGRGKPICLNSDSCY